MTDIPFSIPLDFSTSRRGQSLSGDIDYYMFPEKYESTEMYEDPNIIEQFMRETLKDTGPETSTLFAHEEARRNNYSVDRLNLREGGARILTEPWKNDEFDLQFHDKDARGWSTEQPWKEYEKVLRHKLKHIDFKDDGDYSVMSGVINPDVLYRRIRNTQNEFAQRFKNFETAFVSQRAGGVGVYDNMSDVYKMAKEDPYAVVGNITADEISNTPAITRLSNIVHSGSKNLYVNTTTDHRVKVAQYGSNYKNRGLDPLVSRINNIEDDRRIAKSREQKTKSIAKLMSSRVDGTSAQGARDIQQLGESPNESNRYNKYDETLGKNRNNTLLGDIIALMGYTKQEIKYLENEANKNNKQAKHSLNDLRTMVEYVQRIPITEQKQFKDYLITKGLTPGNYDTVRRSTIINPKIIEFMDLNTRKQATHQDSERARHESKSLQKMIDTIPVFITKHYGGSNDGVKLKSKAQDDGDYGISLEIYNYKAKIRELESKNRKKGTTDIDFTEIHKSMLLKSAPNNLDNYKLMNTVKLDNNFGENRFLDRHGLQMGSKQTHRYVDKPDMEDSIQQTARKNPKNLH